jgi:hypothetical protein
MSRKFRDSFLLSMLIAAIAVAIATTEAQDRVAPRGGDFRTKGVLSEKVSEAVEKKYAEMSAELQQAIPQRTYQVERGPVEKTKLYRAVPKLLENKFVATVAISTKPKEGGEADRETRQENRQLFTNNGSALRGRRGYPEDLLRLIVWDDSSLFEPFGGFRIRGVEKRTLSQQNKLFVEHCLPADRPNERMIEFLTSADCDRDMMRHPGIITDTDKGTTDRQGWEFWIYAPTADEAQQRAAGLLQLLDGGMSRPMQRYFFDEGNKALAEAGKHFEEVAKQGAVLREEEAKLAKPSEISADILSQLKAQKVMVAVELAGLNARVKACDERLKETWKLPASALQSIGDMKVKAEIERVGIKEKLDQIVAFIGEGDNRQATTDRVAELTKSRGRAYSTANLYQGQALQMSRLYDLYAPLPLKDDQITISPVEWTN